MVVGVGGTCPLQCDQCVSVIGSSSVHVNRQLLQIRDTLIWRFNSRLTQINSVGLSVYLTVVPLTCLTVSLHHLLVFYVCVMVVWRWWDGGETVWAVIELWDVKANIAQTLYLLGLLLSSSELLLFMIVHLSFSIILKHNNVQAILRTPDFSLKM